MLDSGAFSAWSRRETLDLHTYIKFVQRNRHLLESYVTMDMIPGIFGQKRTQEQVAVAAAQSYKNLNVMRKAGLEPITVFHQDEEWEWLDRMLDDGNTYIGLSSGKDSQLGLKIAWLDECFSKFCDKQGRALVRTHGFGITNPVLLHRYPWYSVDSTTWTMTPAFGQILVPAWYGGKFDYLQTPLRMIVSGVQHRSNRKQFETYAHLAEYRAQSSLHEKVANDFLAGCGLTISDVRNNNSAILHAMLYYHEQLVANLGNVSFRHHVVKQQLRVHHKPIAYDRVDIAYATQILNHRWSRILNALNVNSRLVSYYEFLDRSEDELERYVVNGTLGDNYKQRSYKGKNLTKNWSSQSYRNFRRHAAIVRARNAENELVEEIEIDRSSAVGLAADTSTPTLLVPRPGGDGVQRSDRNVNPPRDRVRRRSARRTVTQHSKRVKPRRRDTHTD
jgi:hypothetical protein